MDNNMSSSEMRSGGASNRITYGFWDQPGNFVGKTIRDIRNDYGATWALEQDSSAFIGRERLPEDYVIKEGDQIEFHRKAGEKG